MPFVKGESGNPEGRPKGTSDRRKMLAETLLPHAEPIIEKSVQVALSGEPKMLKACLDKLIPNCKPVSHVTEAVALSGQLSGKANTIVDAYLSGSLSSEQARVAMDLLKSQAQLIEMTELIVRLEALEQSHGIQATS